MVSGPAASQTFNQFVGFGDSTIDSGALPQPSLHRAAAQTTICCGCRRCCRRCGKADQQSGGLPEFGSAGGGLGAVGAVPSDQGGTNFATSGAKNVTINDAITGGFTAAVPTVTQIGNYLAASGGQANPNALYLISSGGNDVGFATGNNAPANPQAYLVSAANSLAGAVATLQAAGMPCYIVVPNLPSSFPTDGGAGNAETRADRLLYNQTLWTSLAASGVNFIPADYNAMRLAIASNPGLFGFQFIDNIPSECRPAHKPGTVNTAWALLFCSSNPRRAVDFWCSAERLIRLGLFADDQHLTARRVRKSSRTTNTA